MLQEGVKALPATFYTFTLPSLDCWRSVIVCPGHPLHPARVPGKRAHKGSAGAVVHLYVLIIRQARTAGTEGEAPEGNGKDLQRV